MTVGCALRGRGGVSRGVGSQRALFLRVAFLGTGFLRRSVALQAFLGAGLAHTNLSDEDFTYVSFLGRKFHSHEPLGRKAHPYELPGRKAHPYEAAWRKTHSSELFGRKTRSYDAFGRRVHSYEGARSSLGVLLFSRFGKRPGTRGMAATAEASARELRSYERGSRPAGSYHARFRPNASYRFDFRPGVSYRGAFRPPCRRARLSACACRREPSARALRAAPLLAYATSARRLCLRAASVQRFFSSCAHAGGLLW